jgi:hypothetical protein
VLGLTAKGEGSVGIGASAKFAAKLEGGHLRCSGKAGLTLGAGLGGNVELDLAMRDGLALLAVLSLMGEDHFQDTLAPHKTATDYFHEQSHQLAHAIVEGCREAENDPKSKLWVRALLYHYHGTLDLIDQADQSEKR